MYPPVGRCIYCPSSESLGKEHIIALSLNGALILPKASCPNCAKATGEIERVCARESFGQFRLRHGFRSRKKHVRTLNLSIETQGADGQVSNRPVAIADLPDVLFLLRFKHTAGVLLGQTNDTSNVEPWIRLGGGAKPIVGDTVARFDAFSFARMLAKIGHSFAVAELGISSFRPLVLDFLFGRSDKLSSLVGGSFDEPVLATALHWLRLRDHVDFASRRHFIVANIRLFACLGAPTYHVVVGEMPWGSALLKQ